MLYLKIRRFIIVIMHYSVYIVYMFRLEFDWCNLLLWVEWEIQRWICCWPHVIKIKYHWNFCERISHAVRQRTEKSNPTEYNNNQIGCGFSIQVQHFGNFSSFIHHFIWYIQSYIAVGTACAIDGRILCQRMKINALILCTEAEIRFHCRLIKHHKMRHFQSSKMYYVVLRFRRFKPTLSKTWIKIENVLVSFFHSMMMKSSWNRCSQQNQNHRTFFDWFHLRKPQNLRNCFFFFFSSKE